jgi:hypothetical protein
MSEDSGIADELRKISKQLGALAEGQEYQQRELAEIKVQVRATNGRVTALEAAQIAQKAVEEERSKFTLQLENDLDAALERKDRVRERALGAVVTLSAVFIGAILADIQFFH